MIRDVALDNFKGVDHLKIKDFGRINIFVGRNETGKSTILEAIGLCLSVTNDFKDDLGKSILKDYFRNKYSSYSNIIKIGEKKTSINLNNGSMKIDIFHEVKGLSGNGHIDAEISKGIDTLSHELSIREISRGRISSKSDGKDFLENEIFEDIKQKYIDHYISTESIIFKGYSNGSLFNVKMGMKESMRRMMIRQSRIGDYIDDDMNEFQHLEDIYQKESISNGFIFYSSERKVNLEQLHDIAVNIKSISGILKKIKKQIDHFQDLRVSNGKFRILSSESDTAIPLEVRGDGLKSFIYMMFMENILEKGTILIEEPENFLHPGLMGSWCNDVISKGSTNQYFISTHSCEMLEYMLENKDLLKDLKIFKMFKDPFDYEAISGEEAYERVIELKEDLRGI